MTGGGWHASCACWARHDRMTGGGWHASCASWARHDRMTEERSANKASMRSRCGRMEAAC
eukprot:353802-Chlamydomonas_euryale.AAC.2